MHATGEHPHMPPEVRFRGLSCQRSLMWLIFVLEGDASSASARALSSLKGLDLSSCTVPRLVDLFLSSSAAFGQRRLQRRGPGSAR